MATLTQYTGAAVVPGAQILVVTFPGGLIAWLYSVPVPGPGDAILANPLTTDGGTGAYDFYTLGTVVITELL